MQEIIVLSACQILSILLLLPMMVEQLSAWFMVYMVIAKMAAQFHQLSWLFVTSLRCIP